MDNYQIIVFSLGDEEYGINTLYTKEIIRIPQVTKIPAMPDFIKGIINLRGHVIPVIDLKIKFGFPPSEIDVDHRILILDLEGMDLGIIVDNVSEVVTIGTQEVEKLSMEISMVGGNSVLGIVKINQRLILLLNALELKKETLFVNERKIAL